MKKKGARIAAIVILLICALSLLSARPIVFRSVDLPERYVEAIESQSRGVYSSKLPLVPVIVSVDSFSQGRVTYTIYYFPFGTVGMSYSEHDGYNIEKPLTRA